MSIPRISSRTPLRSLPLSLDEKATIPLSFMAVKNTRKARNRTSLLVFLSLVFLSYYIFFIQRPALSTTNASHRTSHNIAEALDAMRNSHIATGPHRSTNQPPLALTPEQELAAVSNFVSSLAANVIPPTVDPALPIDPQLVLEFDTRSSRVIEEVEVMVEDLWTRNPVLLYSKLYSPVSREIKAALYSMNLHPAPTIIDVDIRDDAEVLKPMLLRLTSSSDLPVLLVGGKSVGSVSDIREMYESGELQRRIHRAGAKTIEKKKKQRK